MRITMDKAGRIVVPKEFRDRLGLQPGELEIQIAGAGLHLEPLAGDGPVERDGRPVVAARTGGLPEIVTDGETGLLFDPGSTTGLVAAIRRLADDPDLSARLAAAGAASVRQRFALLQFASSFRQALDEAAVRRT